MCGPLAFFMIISAAVDRLSHFFTVKCRKDLRRKLELKLRLKSVESVAAQPCETLSGQLYSFTFILARITCFTFGGICFMSFYLFIYLFLILTSSLWHYCNILFVALLIPFSYEDKRLAQHWTTHNERIQWHSRLKTRICAEGGHYKHITEINLCRKIKK